MGPAETTDTTTTDAASTDAAAVDTTIAGAAAAGAGVAANAAATAATAATVGPPAGTATAIAEPESITGEDPRVKNGHAGAGDGKSADARAGARTAPRPEAAPEPEFEPEAAAGPIAAGPVIAGPIAAGPIAAGPAVEPGHRPNGEQAAGASRSVPTARVTAIELDLGDLITAYPSARPGPTGSIHGVGVTMLVTDLARSVAFYRDMLGFYEIDGGDGNAVLASGDTRVVLRAVRDVAPVNRRLVHLNLEVGDVNAVYHELKSKGVRFTYAPRAVNRGERLEVWAAAFRDPDGHGIAITQWRNRTN
jgi:catechol 2,3-dioxygenase-like lactoylglutathione lyase family enzyme